jgi:hypothetical protein
MCATTALTCSSPSKRQADSLSAARDIDIERGGRALQHSGIGLAGRMVGMRERALPVAMVRTGIDGVKMRAFPCDRRLDRLLHGTEFRPAVIASYY